jgi:Phosphate-selective porin O and P
MHVARLLDSPRSGRWMVCVLPACFALSGGIAAAQDPPAPAPKQVEAGLGSGVTIRSSDDQASLNIRARVQVRASFIGDADDDSEDLTEIAVRRLRLVFQGTAAGPRLTYYVQLAYSNLDTEADLRLPLRDAYVTWTPTRDFNLRVGQMKVPFSRQRVTSSSALQMVDRSIVVGELNLDRDVGLQVFSRNLLGQGKFGYALGVFGGDGRNRLGHEAGMLYTARMEAWPLGSIDERSEADIQRVEQWRIAVGGSLGYNQNTNRPRSTFGTPYPQGEFDYTHAGLDATVRKRGWSATSELMYRRADRDSETLVVNGSPTTFYSRSGWGAYIQGGYMVTQRLEVTARYGRLRPSAGTDPTFLKARESGAGFSYYISRNDLKIQGDYFRVTDLATGAPVHQARAQFQLYF